MKNIKILNLLPVIYTEGLENEANDRVQLRETILKDTNNLVTLDTVFVERGFSSIEGSYDVGMAVPYIVKKAKWGQESGYNAAILDCFMDPGLDECREALDIPVFGACQSACSLAIRLGGEFSIIGILNEMDRCIKQNLSKYGMINRLKSIPVIDAEVLNIQYNTEKIIKKIVDASKKTIEENKSKIIVFGCTGLAPLVGSIKIELEKNNVYAPIIEPFRAALYDAISCVLMGVTHSKEAYKPIRNKFNNLNY